MIPQSFIDDLLSRVDAAELIGRYVPLKRKGGNMHGLCPFHKEKSPSFTVSISKQFYHCFGCGKNGTALGFVIEHLGMTFPQAVEMLSTGQGLVVPQDDSRPQAESTALPKEKRQALSARMEEAKKFYRWGLGQSQEARDYLKGRGLNGEIAAHFGIGYVPGDRQNLKQVFADYETSPELIECGLVSVPDEGSRDGSRMGRFDRFKARVMFPIRNIRGEIIGFGGRIIGQGEPKYLNSPETPIFAKGNELYGLFEARQDIRSKGYALVTEGYMDVVGLAQFGYRNAVATLGTAVTATHVQLLYKHTDRVVFAFDGDSAGRKAAWRALEASLPYMQDGRRIEFLFLPAEHDPDSFLREKGVPAFESALSQAVALSEYLSEEVASRYDLSKAEGKAEAAAMLSPLIKKVRPGAYRSALISGLAESWGLTDDQLEQYVGLQLKPAMRVDLSTGEVIKRGAAKTVTATFTDAEATTPLSHEQHFAVMLLRDPEVLAEFEPVEICLEQSQADLEPQAWSLLSLMMYLRSRSEFAYAQCLKDFQGHPAQTWVTEAIRKAQSFPEDVARQAFENRRHLMFRVLHNWIQREISWLTAKNDQTGLIPDDIEYLRGLSEKMHAVQAALRSSNVQG
jgi:DNA primase